MLTKIDFLVHKANDLHAHFEAYLADIKHLPTGTKFQGAHFPELTFRNHILKKKADGSSSSLFVLIDAFQDSFLNLSKVDRKAFLKIFKKTNDLNWILSNPNKATRKNSYPGGTGVTTHALLVHLYESELILTAFDIKDHYKKFYDDRISAWCPFCGMEKYKWPERQKEDYDHLLCKSLYPVAAINFKNLIPMGDRCNRIYKKDADVLLNAAGKPTKIVNPFHEQIKPKLSLKGSTFHHQPEKRKWNINVTPKSQKVKAWNEIFFISERLKEEFLVKRPKSQQNPEYDSLVDLFVQNCRAQKELVRLKGIIGDWTLSDLDDQLKLAQTSSANHYYKDSNILKESIYDYLLHHAPKTYKKAILRMVNS
jgi:hypothetical protein